MLSNGEKWNMQVHIQTLKKMKFVFMEEVFHNM